MLALSAGVAAWVALPPNVMTSEQLREGYWANYWSSIKGSGMATSLLAGIAGGLYLSSRMRVLAIGVMVALSLIPGMVLVGIGLASGNLDLAPGAAARWRVEVLCVIIGGSSIRVLKRKLLHRRRPAA